MGIAFVGEAVAAEVAGQAGPVFGPVREFVGLLSVHVHRYPAAAPRGGYAGH